MSKQKLKVYECKVVILNYWEYKNVIMYENGDPTKELYGFKFVTFIKLPYVSKDVIDDCKLNDFVFNTRKIIASFPKPIELKFDALFNLHDLVKRGCVSYIATTNLKYIQLCLDLLELIIINYNE